jgi:hypothetical protein
MRQDHNGEREVRKPKLNKYASELWNTQAKRCEASGYLTPATLPLFLATCTIHGKMKALEEKEDRLHAGLYLKYYDSFAKNAKYFGLIPDPDGTYTDDSGDIDETGMRC